MTTLSPPLSSAVRVTLPLTPLPFCSTSFAFTVVSADALTGTHSMAAAAVSTSELRNLAIRLIGPPRIRCLVCPGQLTTSTCGLKRCFQQTIWGNAELLSAGHPWALTPSNGGPIYVVRPEFLSLAERLSRPCVVSCPRPPAINEFRDRSLDEDCAVQGSGPLC